MNCIATVAINAANITTHIPANTINAHAIRSSYDGLTCCILRRILIAFTSLNADRIKHWESLYVKEDLIELLLTMPFPLKKYVIILQCGQPQPINEVRVNHYIEEYPYLAAVAMEIGVNKVERELKLQISTTNKRIKALNRLKNKTG